jgi:HAMP domain-containing protein
METLFGFNASHYYRDVLVLFAYLAAYSALLLYVVWFWYNVSMISAAEICTSTPAKVSSMSRPLLTSFTARDRDVLVLFAYLAAYSALLLYVVWFWLRETR